MNKYVRVTKLENGTTQIKLFPVKGTTAGYKIFFEDNGASAFFQNLCSEERFLSNSSYDLVKAGSTVTISFKQCDSTMLQPAYTAVLDNCAWADKNIESIQKQLEEQANKIEFNLEVKANLTEIEQAIRTKGYANLIQTLIKKYADQLTNDEVMDIQSTLTTVKEDKRLTSRPSVFSSWK